MHQLMGSRSMKSRAKTAQFGRAAERAPKSIRPAAPARKSVAPAARLPVPPTPRKSAAPAARKSVAPQARKSMPPPPVVSGKKRARPAQKDEAAEAPGKRRLGMRGA